MQQTSFVYNKWTSGEIKYENQKVYIKRILFTLFSLSLENDLSIVTS